MSDNFARTDDNFQRRTYTISVHHYGQHPDGMLLAISGTIRMAVERWCAEQAANDPTCMDRSGARRLPARSP